MQRQIFCINKQSKVLRLAILTAIFLLYFTIPAFAEGANLAVNPGFEKGNPNGSDADSWSVYSWENKGEFGWDASQRHSGQKSVCIFNRVPGDSRYKQEISVRGNACYRISCWIKTENAGLRNKGANLSVEGLPNTSGDIKGTSDWVRVELYGRTDSNQKSFVLTLGLGGYGSLNTGKAWFDDVSVEEAESIPSGTVLIRLYGRDRTGATANPATAAEHAGSGGVSGTAVMMLIIALVVISSALYIYFSKRSSGGSVPSGKKGADEYVASLDNDCIETLKLDKKDVWIMSSMTLVYLIIALVNLGSLNVPQTSWKASKAGESLVVDLGRQVSISRIYYYGGLGDGSYNIEYLDGTGSFKPLAAIRKKDIYVWKYERTPDVRAQRLKITVDSPGASLNEVGVFEKGSSVPVKGIKIVESSVDPGDTGRVENLFDEQDAIDYGHTYLSGMIFDEIYHARTAYEYLHRLEPLEWTHPPLGKILISIGLVLFGMSPFGWRITGTLFGAAMIPLMYMFGKKLFKKSFYAFCTAFLMMFDFMHFSLTRIATIDVYGTFFVILMYYFMYDYFVNKSYTVGFKKSLRPLFLSGLFFGLGAASKWIGLYAGGGLALLFFMAKYREYGDYRLINSISHMKQLRPAWMNSFTKLYLNRTFLFCTLFFIIIPAAIYSLSYIPYMLIPGPNHGLDVIIRNQRDMLNYHSVEVLGATHPFSSRWWEWPIIRRPLETYSGSDLASGMSSSMTIMGNPAIWWVGIAAVIFAAVNALKKRDRKMLVLFIAMAFQYLPWVPVERVTYIYHFFSTVPFVILSIVYGIKTLTDRYPKAKYPVYFYLGAVFLLFVMFYPVLSGLEVPRWYVEHVLLWFRGWWVF